MKTIITFILCILIGCKEKHHSNYVTRIIYDRDTVELYSNGGISWIHCYPSVIIKTDSSYTTIIHDADIPDSILYKNNGGTQNNNTGSGTQTINNNQ